MKKHFTLRALTAALALCLLAAIPVSSEAASAAPSPSPSEKAETGLPITIYDKVGGYSISDAAGVDIQHEDGVQSCETGTRIETNAASYVWVTVGDTFWLKLDECSSVTVNTSGKNADVLLNEGRIFYCFTAHDRTGSTLRVRTAISSLEAVNSTGILERRLITTLDSADAGRIGRVENDAVLTVLSGEAELTFWKTEAITPGSIDRVKHQTMSVNAGEEAFLQDITVLDEPNEEDGGRAVRREQTSKVSELDMIDALERYPFAGKEYVTRAAMLNLLTAEEGGASIAELQDYGRNIVDRLEQAEKEAAEARQKAQAELKQEQETFKAMVDAVSVYWYEVVSVFPLSREEILNPTPTPPTTPGPTPTPPPGVFTVTFMNGDAVFGVQQITENWYAGVPTLTPTRKGEWRIEGTETAFDFYTTPITGNLTLCWFEQ